MTDQTSELISIAKALPVEERAEIIDSLLESIRPTDPQVDELWKSEIERRIAKYESGETHLIPGEDVFAKIRERLDR